MDPWSHSARPLPPHGHADRNAEVSHHLPKSPPGNNLRSIDSPSRILGSSTITFSTNTHTQIAKVHPIQRTSTQLLGHPSEVRRLNVERHEPRGTPCAHTTANTATTEVVEAGVHVQRIPGICRISVVIVIVRSRVERRIIQIRRGIDGRGIDACVRAEDHLPIEVRDCRGEARGDGEGGGTEARGGDGCCVEGSVRGDLRRLVHRGGCHVEVSCGEGVGEGDGVGLVD